MKLLSLSQFYAPKIAPTVYGYSVLPFNRLLNSLRNVFKVHEGSTLLESHGAWRYRGGKSLQSNMCEAFACTWPLFIE